MKEKKYYDNTPEKNNILINELNNEVNIFNKKFTAFFKVDDRAYVNSRQILYDEVKNVFYKKGKTFGREIKDISYIIDHIAKYKAIRHLHLTTEYCKHLQTLTGNNENLEKLDRNKRILEGYLFTSSNFVQFVGNYTENTINQAIDKSHLGLRHVQIERGGKKRKTKKKPRRKKMRKTRSTTKSRSKVKKV